MSTSDIVNAWFNERLRGAPLSLDTPAYNQVFQALPDLIARLEAAPLAPAEAEAAKAPEPKPAPKPAPEPAPAEPQAQEPPAAPKPEPQA